MREPHLPLPKASLLSQMWFSLILVLLSLPSHRCMQPQGTVIVILSSATCKTLDLELFLQEMSAHQDN